MRYKEAQGLRQRTLQEYTAHFRHYSDFLTQEHGTETPQTRHMSVLCIEEYVGYLRTRKRRYASSIGRTDKTVGLSPATINIRLRFMRTFSRFLFERGFTAEDEAKKVPFLLTDENDAREGLTDDEVHRLLASYDLDMFAEWRDYVLCALLLDTGLRIGEAVTLTMDRVDHSSLTLAVPSQVAKNRKNRHVPMSGGVSKLLHELHAETEEFFGPTDALFLTAYGEPYGKDSFRKRLNRRKGRLGMRRLHPNMFRHTFAREYSLAGGDLFTLQRILDHADIKTTRKYVNLSADQVRKQHAVHTPFKKYIKRR